MPGKGSTLEGGLPGLVSVTEATGCCNLGCSPGVLCGIPILAASPRLPAHPSSEPAGLAAAGLVLSSVNSSCRLVPRPQGLSSQNVASTWARVSSAVEGVGC